MAIKLALTGVSPVESEDIEYGGLPVKYCVFVILLCCKRLRLRASIAATSLLMSTHRVGRIGVDFVGTRVHIEFELRKRLA